MEQTSSSRQVLVMFPNLLIATRMTILLERRSSWLWTCNDIRDNSTLPLPLVRAVVAVKEQPHIAPLVCFPFPPDGFGPAESAYLGIPTYSGKSPKSPAAVHAEISVTFLYFERHECLILDRRL